MKKGKGIITVTIGIVCFVLTYTMFLQFKTVEETNITEIESLTTQELQEKIVTWREKYEEVSEKLIETNEKIAEYKEKREANQEASELLDSELLQAQTLAGETDVKGDGIVITLVDSEDRTIDSYTILYLINELKAAGAEAISINEQRIVNMSDIVDIDLSDGSHYILINKDTNAKLVSPYTIKVIGDQKYLESALTKKTVGFIDQYPNNTTVEKQNNIIIPKYSKEISIKYIDMEGEE